MDDTQILERFSAFNADLREFRTLLAEQKPSVSRNAECLAGLKLEVAAVKHEVRTQGETVRELKAFCDRHRGTLIIGGVAVTMASSAIVSLIVKFIMM
jgi:hypothetical protein